MRYVSFLLVALLCLGMSSSVLARTVSYTFEGVFNSAPETPFAVGDVFSGYVKYETDVPLGDSGDILLTHFRINVNGPGRIL